MIPSFARCRAFGVWLETDREVVARSRCDRVAWHDYIDDLGHLATMPDGAQVSWPS